MERKILNDPKIKVFNLSSTNISPDEISVLSLGTKFVPSTKIRPEEVKIDILNFSRKLLLKARFYNSEWNDSSLIRPKSSYIPKEVNSQVLKGVIEDLEIFANEFPEGLNKIEFKDNLTADQRNSITVFKNRKGIVYFEADKGSSVVILNENFYKFKVLEILNSIKYVKLVRNVDYFVLLKLNRFVKKYENCLTKPERTAITKFDYRTTNIYGLPKLHKSKSISDALLNVNEAYLQLENPADLCLRLIFGGPNNPTSGLANLVNVLLKPFVGKVNSRVKDVFDFINRIPEFMTEDLPYIEIISVDVKSMYENLEQNLGLPALRYFLTRYKDLLPPRFSVDFVIDAMKFVLENNTGYFNGEFYNQVTGTATGIKPAPQYADLAMGYLEIKLFYKLRAKLGKKVAFYFWNFYRRYLDDGLIFWDERVGDFDEVFELLNRMYPSINFTIERSKQELKYLDILIYKTTTGFKTVVKNKDTDSGSYLPFTSSHPRHCKTNIPFSMARRIKALTDDDHLSQCKMEELSSKLKASGYPEGLIHSAVERARGLSTLELRKTRTKSNDDNFITFVHTYDPAYPGLLEGIKNITSRLFTSRECKPIFGETKIIDSRREPMSLKRLFQHSKFDGSGMTVNNNGVSKCGLPNCKLCFDIIEGNEILFSKTGKIFRIKSNMNCTARNVVYALFCSGCDQFYIGETVCLRDRTNTHRSNSKYEGAGMEVSKHLFRCGQGFKICPILKVSDECKIARLVKEDLLIKLLKPDLNADRRNLLHLQLK